jgi:hypothetical protein
VQPERAQKAQVALISLMEEKHWSSVREIYQAGIDTGHRHPRLGRRGRRTTSMN